MRLLLDQGNTRLKWCLVDSRGNSLGAGFAMNSDRTRSELVRASAVADGRCERVIASIVGSKVGAGLDEAVRQVFGLPVEKVCSVRQFGKLRNGYERPELLGVDRWVALIAAMDVAAGRPCIVVDAGTAVTVDGLDADGLHLGGYIVPGMQSQRVLLEQRAGLAPGAASSVGSTWGRNTAEAIGNGIAMQIASLIERAAVELDSRVNDTCEVLLTGGDGPLLAPLVGRPVTVRDDLLFRGLWLWSALNGRAGVPADQSGET